MGSSSGKTSKAERSAFLLILEFSKQISNHVVPSPQSHSATVSSDGISGSRAAKPTRRRICLASWGWVPVPRRARTAEFRAARELPAAPAREGEGGSVYPGARMGALLYE